MFVEIHANSDATSIVLRPTGPLEQIVIKEFITKATKGELIQLHPIKINTDDCLQLTFPDRK